MAFAPVIIPEWLRPWHNAGVLYLLADAPLTAQDAVRRPVSVVPADFYWDVNFLEVSVNALPSFTIPIDRPSDDAVRTYTETTTTGDFFPEPALSPRAFSVSWEEVHDVQEWPLSWRLLLDKNGPSPLLWTYHELGFDLLNSRQSIRGTLFRRLFADLRLPKGSSVFWPTALPPDDMANTTLRVERGLFWTGVMRLQARVVIVFGAQGLWDMGLEESSFPVYQQRIVNGKLVVAMPDIDLLLSDETRLPPVFSFLQAVLKPFIPV